MARKGEFRESFFIFVMNNVLCQLQNTSYFRLAQTQIHLKTIYNILDFRLSGVEQLTQCFCFLNESGVPFDGGMGHNG